MNKRVFLERLRDGLSGFPPDDVEERLTFYDEMIDDRMEDGLTEEAAVAEIGSVDDIVSQITEEIPLQRLVMERMRPKRRLRAWETALLILGAPLWIPLLIAAFAILLSVYIVIWAVILSLWAVEISFIVCAVGSTALGVVLICTGTPLRGLFMISAGLVLAGLSVFLFFGCKAAVRGTLILTKKISSGIKSMFLRKGNAK